MSTDISSGGNAEKQELTLLKFRTDLGDGEYLVAATLRPETVYGQTNFWVDPDTEYVKARVGSETWIISREAAEKLSRAVEDALFDLGMRGASFRVHLEAEEDPEGPPGRGWSRSKTRSTANSCDFASTWAIFSF